MASPARAAAARQRYEDMANEAITKLVQEGHVPDQLTLKLKVAKELYWMYSAEHQATEAASLLENLAQLRRSLGELNQAVQGIHRLYRENS